MMPQLPTYDPNDPDENHRQAIGWLATHFAYCPALGKQGAIVPIAVRETDRGYQIASMKTLLARYSIWRHNRNGTLTQINPIEPWLAATEPLVPRLVVDGYIREPTLPPGCVAYDGGHWINTYYRPVHPSSSGSTIWWDDFITYLIPNRHERRWFTQWLAHKLKHPEIPGVAVIMVTPTQGTGRGALFEIISRLLGQAYTLSLHIDMITGRSGQAQYNAWQENLLVAIDETKTADDSRYREKRDILNHIRSLVEPRRKRILFTPKYGVHHTGLMSTTFLFFSNNLDALPLIDADRRFYVITNTSEKRLAPYFAGLQAAFDKPENIGALARHLAQVDLTGFSAYEAPPSEGRDHMIQASTSALDEAFEWALSALPGAYQAAQVTALIQAAAYDHGWHFPQQATTPIETLVDRKLRERCYRIGDRDGHNAKPLVGGSRAPAWTHTLAEARRWSQSHPTKLRDELKKGAEVVAKCQEKATSEGFGTIVSIVGRRAKTPGKGQKTP